MIDRAISSSLELRSKKELIQSFISRVNIDTQVDNDRRTFVLEQKETDLAEIIESEHLKEEPSQRLINGAF